MKRVVILLLSSFLLSSYPSYIGAKGEGSVYMCTGKYSKRYHKKYDCEGLESCRARVVAVSLEEALDEGRTPCGYCYGRR